MYWSARARARIVHTLWIPATMALLFMLCSSQLQAATVNLAWDRNPESNIASYVISYGTSSKSYTTT